MGEVEVEVAGGVSVDAVVMVVVEEEDFVGEVEATIHIELIAFKYK